MIRHGLWDEPIDSDPMSAALLKKSERLLAEVLHDYTELLWYEKYSYFPLEQATILGWCKGCEILLDNGWAVRSASPILRAALISGDADTITFWLAQRRFADESELSSIGDPIDCLNVNIWGTKATETTILINDIIEQRRLLKATAEANLPPKHMWQRNRLPDAQAKTIFDILRARGVTLDVSLRPTQHSIFHAIFDYHLTTADMLYEAGFRDLEQTDYEPQIPSPLIWNIVKGNFSLFHWLRAKGANMADTWPGSGVTVIQCLGSSFGALQFHLVHEFSRGNLEQLHDYQSFWLSLFEGLSQDQCHCGCTKGGGCTFVACFVKAAMNDTNPQGFRIQPRIMLFLVASWVSIQESQIIAFVQAYNKVSGVSL
jgi:hypothetical protein